MIMRKRGLSMLRVCQIILTVLCFKFYAHVVKNLFFILHKNSNIIEQ